MLKENFASRLPESRQKSCTIRYSRLSPLKAGLSGCLSNDCRSSQRSVAARGGDAFPRFLNSLSEGVFADPDSKRESALGLTATNGAVEPESFCTFTRNCRQPCSTNSGLAGPCATLTRFSGLIVTPNKQCASKVVWIFSQAVSLSWLIASS